jgi:hypothetical protein
LGQEAAASSKSTPDISDIESVFCALNYRGALIDRQITILPAEDPGRDILWMELEEVLKELWEVVERLASSPSRQLSELRIKASTLAVLLRSDEAAGGRVMPDEGRCAALALSLANDIGRLLGG